MNLSRVQIARRADFREKQGELGAELDAVASKDFECKDVYTNS